uniref:Ovule protein n=1 Tax=Haemonchus placei TaxID=6290 RepID=A0A0N4WSR9_HAEPC
LTSSRLPDTPDIPDIFISSTLPLLLVEGLLGPLVLVTLLDFFFSLSFFFFRPCFGRCFPFLGLV